MGETAAHKTVNPCAICTKTIKEDDLTDFTGLVYLSCAIQELEGCTDQYDTFIYCFECWSPCCYRQMLPISDLRFLQRLRGKRRFLMGGDVFGGK